MPDELLSPEAAERFRQLEAAQRNRGKKEKKPTAPPVPTTILPAPAEAKGEPPVDRVAALKAKYQAVTDEFEARVIERNAIRDRVKMSRAVLNAMERVCGLLPAQTVITVPNADGEAGTILERFENIRDDKERTRFFKEHRSELEKLINMKPTE